MVLTSMFQASAVQNTMKFLKLSLSFCLKNTSASKGLALLRKWHRLNGEYQSKVFRGFSRFCAYHDGNNSASHQAYGENASND
jgi:hypothetical protein